MNRDPRLLYRADIRKRILDEVAANIARLATRRKVGRLVSVGIGVADTGAVADIASLTTPLPGGVGPVTVAMLMRNAAIAFEKQIELGWV